MRDIIKSLDDTLSIWVYEDKKYYLYDQFDRSQHGPFKSEIQAERFAIDNDLIMPHEVYNKDEVNQALTIINGVIEVCRESIIDDQDFVYLPLEQIEILAKAADRIDKVNNRDK